MNIEREILIMLKDGLSQAQIADELKELDIKPNSLSSVEKKINTVKQAYKANSLFHLACLLCEEGYFSEIEEDKKKYQLKRA